MASGSLPDPPWRGLRYDRTTGVYGGQGSGETPDLLALALLAHRGAAMATLTKLDDLPLTLLTARPPARCRARTNAATCSGSAGNAATPWFSANARHLRHRRSYEARVPGDTSPGRPQQRSDGRVQHRKIHHQRATTPTIEPRQLSQA